MADYHAVLKRTLSAIPDPNEALRNKMYERARATITAQLDATNPPIAPEAKAAQVAKLEQAIADLEAEYAGAAPAAEAQAPSEAPTPALTDEPAPTDEPVAEEMPVAAGTEPYGTAPMPTAPTPPDEGPAPAVPDEVSAVPAVPPAASPSAGVVPSAGVEPAAARPDPLADAFAKIDAARSEAEREGVPLEPVPAADGAATSADPARSRPAMPADPVTPAGIDPSTPDATIADAAFASGASAVDPASDPAVGSSVDPAAFFNDPAINEREAAALAAAPGAATVSSGRSSGGAIMLLTALLIVGGVVASAFVMRAPILNAVGVEPDAVDTWIARVAPSLASDDAAQPKRVPTIRVRPPVEKPQNNARAADDAVPTRAVDAAREAAARDEAPKLEQRLSREGREVAPSPVREEVNTLPPPAAPVPVDTADAATEDETAEPEARTVQTITVPVRPVAPEALPPAPPPRPQVAPRTADTAATEPETEVALVQPEAPVVATTAPAASGGAGPQTARLIEEGRNERDLVRRNGSIEWSVVQEAPGEGEPEEPAIQGVVRIPERDMTMTVTIKRNTDKALSASHLMTVLFSAPEDRGRTVEDIRGVVAKPSERAQGSPMSILPAPVGQGMFFVALPNNERAIKLNTKLLRDARWFDMPVSYATGRRALLALEKGRAGEKVFDEVLTAWEKAAG